MDTQLQTKPSFPFPVVPPPSNGSMMSSARLLERTNGSSTLPGGKVSVEKSAFSACKTTEKRSGSKVSGGKMVEKSCGKVVERSGGRVVERSGGRVAERLQKEYPNKRLSIARCSGDNDLGIDENEEWDKIESIMASLGTGLAASMGTGLASDLLENDIERQLSLPILDGAAVQSVGRWLASLGLSHLENILVANGFDDLDFMGSSMMTDADLTDIGIDNAAHRERILGAAATLPNTPLDEEYQSIEVWLKSVRLSDYIETFHTHDCTTLERIKNLWDVELNSVLRIGRLGHRNRIMAAARRLTNVDSIQRRDPSILNKSTSWTATPSRPDLDGLQLYKDYTTLRSNGKKSIVKLPTDYNQCNGTTKQGGVKELIIRPPQTGDADCDIKQWRHAPDILLNSSCNYTVQSVPVESLDDTDATRNIITSTRSAVGASDITNIVLSISYRGVNFIDEHTSAVIGCHEISNIYCACQDGDSLNYFAFVTWDPTDACHYCHVFSVDSLALATEIVLTLGEAFEVAYQFTIQSSPTRNSHTPGDTCQSNGFATGGGCELWSADRSDSMVCKTGRSDSNRRSLVVSNNNVGPPIRL